MSKEFGLASSGALIASRRSPAAVSAAGRRGRRWQNVSVQLAVALAFADASIVVLALPQIVVRLHTSISHVTWVIMAYNLALIVTALVAIPFARHLARARALVAGLAIFGLASIGCGLAQSMGALVPLRCLQGVGGGVLLCASLPRLVGSAPGARPTPHGWSAAAAIGMAMGPAAGGILTQVFDWRAIFLAQAPVAALTIALVLSIKRAPEPERVSERGPESELQPAPARAALDPLSANAGLTLLSAGLIGALFLVVLLLINVWRLEPIVAAAVVTAIPLGTALADRLARERSPIVFGALGAALVAAGLVGLSLVTHRELGLVIAMLALVGSGLGLSFPGLTTAALSTRGPTAARAAKTIGARDAGIVIGLLVLTPVFVSQLHEAPSEALPAATSAVLSAPLSTHLKETLAPGLLADYESAPQSQLPNFAPTFARVDRHAPRAARAELAVLQARLDSIVEKAVTGAFKLPFRYAAILAVAVLALVGLGVARSRLRRRVAPA